MPNIKSIKKRIKSTIAVAKVTKVVQLIAVTKLKTARPELDNSVSFLRSAAEEGILLGKKINELSYNKTKLEKFIQSIIKSGIREKMFSSFIIQKIFPSLPSDEYLGVIDSNLSDKDGKANVENGNKADSNPLDSKSMLYTIDSNISLSNKNKKNHVVFAFGSDRGLCGSLNSAVVKSIKNHISDIKLNDCQVNITIVCIGKKILPLLRDMKSSNINVVLLSDGYSDRPNEEYINNLSSAIGKICVKFNADKFTFFFQNFLTILSQEVVLIDIVESINSLISLQEDNIKEYLKATGLHKDKMDLSCFNSENIKIEGNMADISARIINNIYVALVNYSIKSSLLSENVMRMTSMDAATKNGEKLAQSLELKANKIRQTKITADLIDLIGGTI